MPWPGLLHHEKPGYKSAGLDNLSSEHYKYASDNTYVCLSLVFNHMIAHGNLTSKFMDTFIMPIVKDKKGDITNGDNYQPIAYRHLLPPKLWN